MKLKFLIGVMEEQKKVIIRILCVHEFLKIIVVVFGNNKDRLKTDRKLNTIL